MSKSVKTKEPPCTERYARWCERSVTQLMGDLLLDCRGSKMLIPHVLSTGHGELHTPARTVAHFFTSAGGYTFLFWGFVCEKKSHIRLP